MQNDKTEPSRSISANEFGLCRDCVHARFITNDRNSTFLQCQLSFTDPRFVKYPRLPVLACSGFTAKGGAPVEI
jgi:hypothetical protein